MDKISAIALGCMIWIPIMIWGASLVGWMITGEVDVISGILGFTVAILLGFVTLFPPVPALQPITFGAVVLTIILYPFVRMGMTGRELRAVDAEAMERAYEALAMKPDNLGARLKLAKLAAQRGYAAFAVAMVDSQLAYMPKHLYQDELRQLESWKAAARAPGVTTSLPCVDCGLMNTPGGIHCVRCGAPFLLDNARGKLVGKSTGRRLLAAWIAMVAALAAIPLASSLRPALAITVIAAALLIAGIAVVLAFRGGSGLKGGTA